MIEFLQGQIDQKRESLNLNWSPDTRQEIEKEIRELEFELSTWKNPEKND